METLECSGNDVAEGRGDGAVVQWIEGLLNSHEILDLIPSTVDTECCSISLESQSLGGRGRRTRSLRSFEATQSALGQFGEHGVDEGEVALMDW